MTLWPRGLIKDDFDQCTCTISCIIVSKKLCTNHYTKFGSINTWSFDPLVKLVALVNSCSINSCIIVISYSHFGIFHYIKELKVVATCVHAWLLIPHHVAWPSIESCP